MVDAALGRILHAGERIRCGWRMRRFVSAIAVLRALVWITFLALLGWGAATEMRTSYVQSLLFSRLDQNMTYRVASGANDTISYPEGGPYDKRFGYAELPSFITALRTQHFEVDRQARWSPTLRRFVANAGYATYDEKVRGGLQLFDRRGRPLFSARYPRRTYPDFAAIPPLVVSSLLTIEDRYLLDPNHSRRDPAIQWDRFMLAAAGRVVGLFDRRWRQGGASTLVTQIVKFRHSPQGRTAGIGQKLRQMLTAAADAYRHGAKTLGARRRIVTAYLDSTPLGSRPGYGEVTGVPEALWTWYGTDLAEANRVLRAAAPSPAARARKGEIYRQVLSLLLAGRRPGYYLMSDHAALEALTDSYLQYLSNAGVISRRLRDAALVSRLDFLPKPPPPAPPKSDLADKASGWLQIRLMALLDLPSLWRLHRLDLKSYASIDAAAQKRVDAVLVRLGDPGYDKLLGLYGRNLLGGGDPALVNWSIVLYERGARGNYLRIHADSLDVPFDINSGSRLQLGSTAKLRTLITYLDIIDKLHGRLARLPAARLRAIAATAPDRLTGWAARYLARADHRSLKAMLEAAMQRRYSASPASFLTGGGRQSFVNFEKSENSQIPTVEVALEHSINAAFVRVMRDIRDYYIAQSGVNVKLLLSERDNPVRQAYLRRFADEEGRVYLARFYRDYYGLSPQQALDKLAGHAPPAARRLTIVFRALHPDAKRQELGAFLARRLPDIKISDDKLWELYRKYRPGRLSLNDLGYIAGVNPLEFWLVGYLQTHSTASYRDIVDASTRARQEAYAWLFKSKNLRRQNIRIRTVLEQDAFDRILQDWRRQGYPFAELVPSLGTALGASGDRPDALARLMGIIMNDGEQLPVLDIEQLDFADGTPYQTELSPRPRPRRVLAPEVAETVRRALLGVVARGTGRRVFDVYRSADGGLLPVGGKTGTGDNRYHYYTATGALRSERAVDRTATFMFFLGSRFFGTITAYVPGAEAARFHFTSALAVQLLKALRPQFEPLLRAPFEGVPPGPIADTALPTARPMVRAANDEPNKIDPPPIRVSPAGRPSYRTPAAGLPSSETRPAPGLPTSLVPPEWTREKPLRQF